MKALFDDVCLKCSQLTTKSYSTSFSLGIRLLDKSIRADIYAIYGFVRFADEIVDTFHEYPKHELLAEFKKQTYEAIKNGISLNPILQSFQMTVNKHQIDPVLIESFFRSMEMDLEEQAYTRDNYEEYIVGSAEVVGLMCLYVFVHGNRERFEYLKQYAESLGAAFQKVNFLRDIRHDMNTLNRAYFPELQSAELNDATKRAIESDIERDFDEALIGIKQLPKNCRFGVFLAYKYYRCLFNKIRSLPPEQILSKRVRINNPNKLAIMIRSFILVNFGKSWSLQS